MPPPLDKDTKYWNPLSRVGHVPMWKVEDEWQFGYRVWCVSIFDLKCVMKGTRTTGARLLEGDHEER